MLDDVTEAHKPESDTGEEGGGIKGGSGSAGQGLCLCLKLILIRNTSNDLIFASTIFSEKYAIRKNR